MNRLNKFEHKWSIICQKSIIDNQSNNLSLMELLEELQVSVPKKDLSSNQDVIIPISLEIVGLWHNDIDKKGKLNYSVSLFSPSGKEVWGITPKIDYDETKPRLRTQIKMNGLKITKESGEYLFVVKQKQSDSDDFIEVFNVPLVINIVSE